MKNKYITIIAGIVIVLIIGLIIINKNKKVTEPAKIKSYTLSEISPHNNRNDCWTTINGSVYNVTSFIPNHPGGNRILAACGIDATDLFTGKSSLGRLHSKAAQKILETYKIGTLAN